MDKEVTQLYTTALLVTAGGIRTYRYKKDLVLNPGIPGLRMLLSVEEEEQDSMYARVTRVRTRYVRKPEAILKDEWFDGHIADIPVPISKEVCTNLKLFPLDELIRMHNEAEHKWIIEELTNSAKEAINNDKKVQEAIKAYKTK